MVSIAFVLLLTYQNNWIMLWYIVRRDGSFKLLDQSDLFPQVLVHYSVSFISSIEQKEASIMSIVAASKC